MSEDLKDKTRYLYIFKRLDEDGKIESLAIYISQTVTEPTLIRLFNEDRSEELNNSKHKIPFIPLDKELTREEQIFIWKSLNLDLNKLSRSNILSFYLKEEISDNILYENFADWFVEILPLDIQIPNNKNKEILI